MPCKIIIIMMIIIIIIIIQEPCIVSFIGYQVQMPILLMAARVQINFLSLFSLLSKQKHFFSVDFSNIG